MSWHYIKNGAATGPVPKKDLLGMAQRGEISKSSYIWDGKTVKEWSKIESLPEMCDYLFTPKPAAPRPSNLPAAPKPAPPKYGGRPAPGAGTSAVPTTPLRNALLSDIRKGKSLRKGGAPSGPRAGRGGTRPGPRAGRGGARPGGAGSRPAPASTGGGGLMAEIQARRANLGSSRGKPTPRGTPSSRGAPSSKFGSRGAPPSSRGAPPSSRGTPRGPPPSRGAPPSRGPPSNLPPPKRSSHGYSNGSTSSSSSTTTTRSPFGKPPATSTGTAFTANKKASETKKYSPRIEKIAQKLEKMSESSWEFDAIEKLLV